MDEDKRCRALLNWLAVRPGWISLQGREGGVPPISNQTWRGLFNSELPADGALMVTLNEKGEETKATKKRRIIHEIFGAEMMAQYRGPQIKTFWHKRELQSAHTTDMDPTLVREITWELFEHNWRFELVNLDHAAVPQLWADEYTSFTRRDLVYSMFPGAGTIFVWTGEFPKKDEGMAAREWQERCYFVEHFRRIVASWPNAPSILTDSCLDDTTSEAEGVHMEEAVVLFYCQSFWDFFGRAAICPRYIPNNISMDNT